MNTGIKTYYKYFLVVLLTVFCFSGKITAAPAQSENTSLHQTETAELATESESHQPSMFEFSWPVLISQTINFFVLLFILNRFLFTPMGKILEERRESIGRIKLSAEEEHDTALALKEVYEKHLANIEQEAYIIKQQAIKDANLKTTEIILEAREKAERIVEEGEMELFSERQAAWMQLREEVVHLTLTAAERVVEESLDDDIHRKLIERTIERLEEDLPYHSLNE
ncbi:MAG: F0F1 ATP synthase subunit B [Candidatus Rifleibacteriota bacterium]